MGPADFRRIALALNDATEGSHMGHSDFRVDGRIFASLTRDETRGMVALTPEQQETFLREHPSAFQPESGAWGRAGYTRVLFEALDQEALGEALTLAWQNAMRKGTAKRARRRQPAAGSPPRRRPPGRRSRS